MTTSTGTAQGLAYLNARSSAVLVPSITRVFGTLSRVTARTRTGPTAPCRHRCRHNRPYSAAIRRTAHTVLSRHSAYSNFSRKETPEVPEAQKPSCLISAYRWNQYSYRTHDSHRGCPDLCLLVAGTRLRVTVVADSYNSAGCNTGDCRVD